VLVRDIAPGIASSSPSQMAQIGSNLFFSAGTEARGFEPWVLPASASFDSDFDGLSDSAELGLGTNPLDADSDDDGLTDGMEDFVYHTNPLSADSDGDGASDAAEVSAGTDPREPTSVPPVAVPVPALPPFAGALLAALLLLTSLYGVRAVQIPRSAARAQRHAAAGVGDMRSIAARTLRRRSARLRSHRPS
jgi:hypothetical protein